MRCLQLTVRFLLMTKPIRWGSEKQQKVSRTKKGEAAIKKYGDKGKSGVIEIITKKDDYSVIGNSDTLYIRGSSSKPISQNSKTTANVVYIK